MKSIKQQYIDLKEGNLSQANFMRNLRMTLPQYVTNVTSFEDSVKILRNKGILTEADINKNYRVESLIEAKENSYDLSKKPKNPNWTNAQAQKFYSQFDPEDKVNLQSLTTGINIEHNENPDKSYDDIVKIVVKNLKKDPIYYTYYKLTGIRDVKPLKIDTTNTPELMAMQPVTKNNLVSKRAMKPVKDVEKVKASANKANKETNTPVKGIKLMSLVAKSSRGVKKMDATGEKMKKVNVKENKVASTIFDKNANITKGVNDIAKGDKKKLTKEYLMQMIQEELNDMFNN